MSLTVPLSDGALKSTLPGLLSWKLVDWQGPNRIGRPHRRFMSSENKWSCESRTTEAWERPEEQDWVYVEGIQFKPNVKDTAVELCKSTYAFTHLTSHLREWVLVGELELEKFKFTNEISQILSYCLYVDILFSHECPHISWICSFCLLRMFKTKSFPFI